MLEATWISLAKDAPLALVFMVAIWFHYRGLGSKLDANTEAFGKFLEAQGASQERVQQCTLVSEKLDRVATTLGTMTESLDKRTMRINEREAKLDRKLNSRT